MNSPLSRLHRLRVAPSRSSAVIFALSLLAITGSPASGQNPPQATLDFLAAACLDCHSGSGAEGGLDLESLGADLSDVAAAARWVRIHDRVRSGEMPPPDESDQSDESANRSAAQDEAALDAETQTFLRVTGDWIRAAQQAEHEQLGRVRGRRLTSLQTARTLQDLLGIDIPLANRLPEDLPSGGFTTVAEGQSISHFHLEQYLTVVDAALEEAWRRALEGDDPWTKELSAKRLSRTRTRTREPELIDGEAVVWSSRLSFYGRIPATQAREPGWYRFTIRARSLKPPVEEEQERGVWCTVQSGPCVSSAPLMQPIGIFEARRETNSWVYETWLPKGHMLEVRPGDSTLKMARFQGGQAANGEGGAQDVPGIAIESIRMERIYRGPRSDEIRRLLFDDLELHTKNGRPRLISEDPERDARRLLQRFASRAFRRPVSDRELEPYVAAAQNVLAGESPEQGLLEALRVGYRALLCSPRFLYFHEEPGPLDDYAIASRLSYLLWNRMPDEPLMAEAAAGRLRDPLVLRAQVERMLDDPRGADFIRDFAAQWLDLNQIDATVPDRRLHPDFDSIVQQSMLDETHAFLSTMLREDLSVTHLIDSKFTYLNSRLARFYKIPRFYEIAAEGENRNEEWEAEHLQRVALRPEDHRGGVLTQGAILKVTANGTTTSPVIRGVWVAERLLGEHVPPPPESVPAIEPDTRGATTIREMLAKHLADASCASCHVKMDPPGIALENYDPAGRWRTHYGDPRKGRKNRGPAIDTSFTMADGRPFEDLAGFRRLVLSDPRRLARNVTEKLVTYGTGAAPRFVDNAMISEIVDASAESDYGFRSLVHAVVASPIFLSK
ncbi:DUF1592 domain-containing protein [Candidatus Laterigemmans baculatus]|uniref:DUF1592 domain-containing protein n=1 Tax=Candidatus Laterigemmans baculatus TaxID=2770505 RepID=UPI0013DAC5C4|nr:DUF1592 domain-containing protein [Candidatus Laterigemmans baculatus]